MIIIDDDECRYYVRSGSGPGCKEDDFFALQFICYTQSPYDPDEFFQYEIINIFKDGLCEHYKSWNGKSLETPIKSKEIEWVNDDLDRQDLCSKLEFDAVKSLVLRLCKTNEMYFIPEAHNVNPWD